MAPSASKQKRLAEKAAKQSAKAKGSKGDTDASTTTGTSTPTGSLNGSSNTPLTNTSAATSQEDLSAMAKLQIATDRCVPCVWTRAMDL